MPLWNNTGQEGETIMIHLLRALICALILAAPIGSAHAAEIIEADGVYTMGDNDSPRIARDAARADAMRAATEQAGVYVETYTETQNLTLTRDEVRMVAGTVLRVLDERTTPELVGDAWRYRVHLVCAVDTERVDLAALSANRAELARLQAERDALQRTNEALLARYEHAHPAEKGELGAALEENYRLGRIFDEAAAMIQRGETQHAVADLSLLLNDPSVTGSARAYAYYLRGRAYYEMQSTRLALSDFDAAERTPRTGGDYPVWRLYQYRGMIYYADGRYEDALTELQSAWNASDKTDDELWMTLRRAERRAEQERRHRTRGDGGSRGINWTQVITEIIRGSMQQGD